MTGCRGDAPVRVLHVITSLDIGGAERQLAMLLRESAAADGDVRHLGVVSLRPGGVVANQLSTAGVQVWTLGVRGPLSLSLAPIRLASLVRRVQPSAICAWLYHSMVLTAVPGVCPRRSALLWTVRGTWPAPADKGGTRFTAWLAGRLSARSNVIVYNSARARDEHRRAGYGARDVVVHNGIEVAPPTGARTRAGGAELLFVGRYHPMKGVGVLLDALRLVVAKVATARLVMVGPGYTTQNRELQAAVASRGLAHCVTLAGAAEDLQSYYAGSDLLISSSLWGEGFQNVVAEAAVHGCPVVATRVGEAELVLGVDGRLVEPGDPATLAAAVLAFLALPPEARAAEGARLRAHVQGEFSPTRMVRGFDQAIGRAMTPWRT